MPTSADWDGMCGLQGLRLPPPCGVDNPLAGPRNCECECERARLDGEKKLYGRTAKKEGDTANEEEHGGRAGRKRRRDHSARNAVRYSANVR